MQRSWSANNRQPLLYTAQFLKSCFEYPGASLALAPTLYEGEEPVAFAAGFPRSILYQGRKLRVIISSFLSVLPEYQKSGYGVILWTELVKRAQAAGFDGMVNYCVDGEPMNSMIGACCQRLGLPTERIFSVRYLSQLLRREPAGNGRNSGTPEILSGFLEAAGRIEGAAPLVRVWSTKEAEWQCLRRSGCVAAQRTEGTRRGVLTGYIMEVVNKERTKCLLVEDILWDALEDKGKKTLLNDFLDCAALAGAQVVVTPVLGYADMAPFSASRFMRSPRLLHAYLSLWSAAPVPESVNSMYLDVF